jgi:hypothetical protein
MQSFAGSICPCSASIAKRGWVGWEFLMQQGADDSQTNAFSHELLDQEAARHSQLLSFIQEELSRGSAATPATLYALAEQYDREGRHLEAEFIYLHFLNVWEGQYLPSYPISFTSLREYAGDLLRRIFAS